MFNKASHITVYGGNFSVQRTELNISELPSLIRSTDEFRLTDIDKLSTN